MTEKKVEYKPRKLETLNDRARAVDFDPYFLFSIAEVADIISMTANLGKSPAQQAMWKLFIRNSLWNYRLLRGNEPYEKFLEHINWLYHNIQECVCLLDYGMERLEENSRISAEDIFKEGVHKFRLG